MKEKYYYDGFSEVPEHDEFEFVCSKSNQTFCMPLNDVIDDVKYKFSRIFNHFHETLLTLIHFSFKAGLIEIEEIFERSTSDKSMFKFMNSEMHKEDLAELINSLKE